MITVQVTDKQSGKTLTDDEILKEINRDRSAEWTNYDIEDLYGNAKDTLSWIDTEYYQVDYDLFKAGDVVNIPSGMGGILPALLLASHSDGTYQVRCIHHEYFPLYLLTVKKSDVSKHGGYIAEKDRPLLKKALSLASN